MRLTRRVALVLVATLGAFGGQARAQPKVHVDTKVTAFDFSPKGDWLAVGQGAGSIAGDVSVYSMIRPGAKPKILPAFVKPVTAVVFLDEGNYLAAMDETSELVVWSWPDMQPVFSKNLRRDTNRPNSTFYLLGNPKIAQLAWIEVGAEAPLGQAEVVEVPSGRVVTSIGRIPVGQQVGWSRDGGYMTIGGAVWHWDTFKSWRPPNPGVVAVSASGTTIAYAPPQQCSEISIIEIASGKTVNSIELEDGACPSFLWFVDKDRSLLWLSEVGEGGDRSDTLMRWDARRDRVKTIKRKLPVAKVAQITPDEKYLATDSGQTVHFLRIR